MPIAFGRYQAPCVGRSLRDAWALQRIGPVADVCEEEGNACQHTCNVGATRNAAQGTNILRTLAHNVATAYSPRPC